MDQTGRRQSARTAIAVGLVAVVAASAGWFLFGRSPLASDQGQAARVPKPPVTTVPAATTTANPSPDPAVTSTTVRTDTSAPPIRPFWLGTRTLPTTADGAVVVPQTTPPELIDRRLPTIDVLAPPPPDAPFQWSSGPVDDTTLARSTWIDGCPVGPDELTYLTMSFWGFDDRAHTGEMIVHRNAAEDIVSVFRSLFDARFPIEEMRVVTPADLEAAPTGDGNNTTAFVCRAVTGGTSFSQHAYGLAIDLNPFHNPYQRQQLVLPELAGAYLDRERPVPGMVLEGGPVVEAFEQIGWWWGGRWRSLKDYQHFSHNNR